jgi:hypothetical protein
VNFAHCLPIVFIFWKYTDIFRGGGGVFCEWGGFSQGESSLGREISGG